jgi:hypothetical protein
VVRVTRPLPDVPRSLGQALRMYSDDDLAAVLRARPDVANPLPTDIGQLTSRATSRGSALRALERLDRFTLDVLDAVAVRDALVDGPNTLSDVAELLGVDPETVRPVLRQLRIHALLWGADDHLNLVRIVREILGHPAGLGPSARQCLRVYPPRRLARLVTDLGLRPTGNPVSDAAAAAELFADPVRLDALLAELPDPQAHAYLDRLKDGPPTAWVDNTLRDVDLESAKAPVEQLLARGLLVPVEPRLAVLPGEIGLHLRHGHIVSPPRVAPPAPATKSHDPQRVDQLAAGAALDVVRRVGSLLESWGQSPPAVLRAGGLGVRDLRRTAKELDVDETAAALYIEISLVVGLVGPSYDKDDVWLPTAQFDKWMAEEPATQWAQLADAWLATSRVPGLVGGRDENDRLIPALGPFLYRPALLPDVRRLTLDVIAGLPTGASASADDVQEIMRWRRPRQSGPFVDDLVRWTLREAETLGVTGAGALSRHGRALLAGRDAAATLATSLPTLLDHILLQADLTAIAPGPLQPTLAKELALAADVESRGGATVYRFSPQSLRRALDAGRTPDEVRRFLAGISRTPVPQPLGYLVDDLARRHGEVRVGSARSFVRCDDETVLTHVLADRRTAKLKLRRLAPTVAVSDQPGSQVVELLRGAGYLPVTESADGSVRITTPRQRRAPTDAHPIHFPLEPTELSGEFVALAIRTLRASEEIAGDRPQLELEEVHDRLETAVRRGKLAWVRFVDERGNSITRLVAPMHVRAGWLVANEHHGRRPCYISLSHISNVVVLGLD